MSDLQIRATATTEMIQSRDSRITLSVTIRPLKTTSFTFCSIAKPASFKAALGRRNAGLLPHLQMTASIQILLECIYIVVTFIP